MKTIEAPIREWSLGTTISHCRILRKPGGGGMDVLYEAEDIRLHRHVALKFLPEGMTHDHQALERFQREAQRREQWKSEDL